VPLDPVRARVTYLEAVTAAIWIGEPVAETAMAALSAPPAGTDVDVVLDALATRVTHGYVAAAPLYRPALAALDTRDGDIGRVLWLFATESGDFASARALAARHVQLARDSGAFVHLQFALNFLAVNELLAGDLVSAAAILDEDRLIADITGNRPVGYAAPLLAAFRGRSEVRGHRFADYADALWHNGLGRHDTALEAARRGYDQDVIGYHGLITAELAEAASRTGDHALVQAALTRATELARVTPTEWSRGIEARVHALASTGGTADALYRSSLDLFARAELRVDVARGHLLYGEWLRREGQRIDARDHLRTAHDTFTAIGMAAFADRARRELMATGETVRKRTAEVADQLTAQEFQIARLAREGFSNPEIGTRLFISPRTGWAVHRRSGRTRCRARPAAGRGAARSGRGRARRVGGVPRTPVPVRTPRP
jgi:DNA-binding CsgD family transcriptional regulator